MTLLSVLLLFFSAVLGGTLNSVAGGGSFFTFPALVFSGVPVVPANASSAVALWPASLASAGAYRKELQGQDRTLLLVLGITSLIGGIVGAILLVKTPSKIFQGLLPYLLLFATLLFTFSPTITAWLRMQKLEKATLTPGRLVQIGVVQFIISVYGGYFGGGIGIMMLASLAVMGLENIHVMNAIKNVMATFINGAAIVTFIIFHLIYWPQALIMVVGSIVGGYGSAYYARKINPRYVRVFVIVVGFALSIIFFFQS